MSKKYKYNMNYFKKQNASKYYISDYAVKKIKCLYFNSRPVEE